MANSNNDSTRSVGNKAEELACQYLVEKGYIILGRNFQIRGGEIDIIAKLNNLLVFVEVKARFNHSFGLPSESITPWKIRALLKTAQFYIAQRHLGNVEYRFDLVSIDYAHSFKNPQIDLITNITQ